MSNDLQTEKLRAEIALINAQTAKTNARAKLNRVLSFGAVGFMVLVAAVIVLAIVSKNI